MSVPEATGNYVFNADERPTVTISTETASNTVLTATTVRKVVGASITGTNVDNTETQVVSASSDTVGVFSKASTGSATQDLVYTNYGINALRTDVASGVAAYWNSGAGMGHSNTATGDQPCDLLWRFFV